MIHDFRSDCCPRIERSRTGIRVSVVERKHGPGDIDSHFVASANRRGDRAEIDYFLVMHYSLDLPAKEKWYPESDDQRMALARDLVVIPNAGGLRSTEILPHPDRVPQIRKAVNAALTELLAEK